MDSSDDLSFGFACNKYHNENLKINCLFILYSIFCYQRMCFNGAKSWYFGWYSDRHLEIDFGSDESGVRSYLLSINDYLNGLSNSASQNTVVKLNAVGNERDAYILYNRAKGINVETDEYPDEVTIVEVESKQARYQRYEKPCVI